MGIPPLTVVVADLHASIDAAEKAAEAGEFGLCCIHLRHGLDLARMTVLADRFDPVPGAEVADDDEDDEAPPKVVDLMGALEDSVAAARQARHEHRGEG